MRVLVVEDESTLAQQLADSLAHAGYAVDVAPDGIEGEHLGAVNPYDAAVLDLGLPRLDGLSVLRRWRQAGNGMPVLILTARDSWIEKVEGIDAGADDYLAKPFRMPELLARVRAQLRVYDNSEDATFLIGPYVFRPSLRLLQDATRNRKVRLTDKECRILKYLLRANGQPVSRTTLLAEVWGFNSGVTTHTLETHVYRLRQKIEPDPATASLLLTEGGGYRLDPQAGRVAA